MKKKFRNPLRISSELCSNDHHYNTVPRGDTALCPASLNHELVNGLVFLGDWPWGLRVHRHSEYHICLAVRPASVIILTMNPPVVKLYEIPSNSRPNSRWYLIQTILFNLVWDTACPTIVFTEFIFFCFLLIPTRWASLRERDQIYKGELKYTSDGTNLLTMVLARRLSVLSVVRYRRGQV
jgi:hypothetical protein